MHLRAKETQVALATGEWPNTCLAECGYKAAVKVSWAPGLTEEGALDACRDAAARAPKKRVGGYSPIALPRRLWQNIVTAADVPEETTWAECSKKRLHALAPAPPPIPTPQDRRAADERMRRVTREGWRGVEGAAHQRRGRTS